MGDLLPNYRGKRGIYYLTTGGKMGDLIPNYRG